LPNNLSPYAPQNACVINIRAKRILSAVSVESGSAASTHYPARIPRPEDWLHKNDFLKYIQKMWKKPTLSTKKHSGNKKQNFFPRQEKEVQNILPSGYLGSSTV
jgi:hypothetical protein